ncbi:PREDICTED: ankyrin repeat and SOCS box protein 16 [Thamnophis sirtalis]|uniref:Ankyrin repeat and SOCS box protein 16 n=1 Tax=Thamnophis sirtalis TaxID=35019 RepID=A0A6I9Y2I4_9SAUR|nr:PREDICTED: ankyrin repeat and SOCS box protein 16 [Thamnophis sirtalis]
MSKETFVFTSSTLRSLRLQREKLEWEERQRAASHQWASQRYRPTARSLLSLPKPTRHLEYCRDPALHNTLYTGDLPRIQSIFKDKITSNLIVETQVEELEWSADQGLWVLTAQKKHTSPLRITAARGYQDCVKHLLLKGADVNAVIGGKAALHDSCANHHEECTRLLLRYGANANILSEEGLAPLHLCTTHETLPCAQLLLEYGALVNQKSRDGHASPLHVASRNGLEDHVKLYLCYGANIAHRNREGETALNTACANADRPEGAGRYYQVVKQLLDGGANVQIAGRKNHTPLHNACSNCHIGIVELLLQHGAEVNIRNCAGNTPMDCALQAVEDYLEEEPEKVIVMLLNHGAASINPKMLKFCASSPRSMEIILNSYDRVLSCDSWVESVSTEMWQEHQMFYDSALFLVNQPRPLQHLARCAIRKQLGIHCHKGISQLKLPSALHEYLFLPLKGYLK